MQCGKIVKITIYVHSMFSLDILSYRHITVTRAILEGFLFSKVKVTSLVFVITKPVTALSECNKLKFI